MNLKMKFSYTAVISYDKENEADILSIIASSAALAISGMPFMGPVGASRLDISTANMF